MKIKSRYLPSTNTRRENRSPKPNGSSGFTRRGRRCGKDKTTGRITHFNGRGNQIGLGQIQAPENVLFVKYASSIQSSRMIISSSFSLGLMKNSRPKLFGIQKLETLYSGTTQWSRTGKLEPILKWTIRSRRWSEKKGGISKCGWQSRWKAMKLEARWS